MGVPSIGSPPAPSWEFGENAGSWYHEDDQAGKGNDARDYSEQILATHGSEGVHAAPGPKIE